MAYSPLKKIHLDDLNIFIYYIKCFENELYEMKVNNSNKKSVIKGR